MRTRWLLWSLLAACAADGTDTGHWTFGKGDGVFDLIEAGPAPVGDQVDIALDHRVPAYRVESYGGTRVAISLTGHETNAHFVVEGPLAGDGDKVAVGAGAVVGETGGSDGSAAKLDLVLDQPGVYRILAGTEDSLGHGLAATGSLTLAVTCEANCWRAQID